MDNATRKEIEAIRERVEAVPDGPWFVSFDDAADCPDHHNSGLAMVDTGRVEEWPIARLCEWPRARFIAASPTDTRRLLAIIDEHEREIRRSAFDEAINLAMEINTDAPDWKERIVVALQAARDAESKEDSTK